MTKTLNQIIIFSSTKIRISFSATLGIRIFFLEKKYTPPLEVKWSVPNIYIDTGVVNLCISLAKISTVKPLLRSHLQGKEKVVF